MAAAGAARGVMLVAWVLVMVGYWGLAAQAVVQTAPTLRLHPDEAEPGGAVQVSGAGWDGQCRVDLAFDDAPLGSVGPEQDGTFTVDVDVPPDTAPGPYRVVATGRDFSGDDVGDPCAGTSSSRAEAPLQVLATPRPALELSDTSLDFGRVAVGAQAVERLTATNAGTGELTITAVELPDGDTDAFAVSEDGCTQRTLPAGSSCPLTIVFRPAAEGRPRAVLTIASNDPGRLARVVLSGTGLPSVEAAPRLELSHANIDLGRVAVGGQAVERLTARNAGTGELTITAVELSYGDTDVLTVTDDGCTQQTLPAGGTCALTIVFEPTAEGQARAELAVTADDAAGPHLVTVAGTGSREVAVVDPGNRPWLLWAFIGLLGLLALIVARILRPRSPRWVRAHVAVRPGPHRAVELTVDTPDGGRSHAVRFIARPDTGTQMVEEVRT